MKKKEKKIAQKISKKKKKERKKFSNCGSCVWSHVELKYHRS